MTEAERLRAQAQRCLHLANETRDKAIADALMGLAAKSLERAADLEERRKPQKLQEEGNSCSHRGLNTDDMDPPRRRVRCKISSLTT